MFKVRHVDLYHGCTPFCEKKCEYADYHHPLLIALVNSSNNAGFIKFHEHLAKLLASRTWHKDDPIPDPVPEFRYPVVHWAAVLGKLRVIRLCIDDGFNLNKTWGNRSETALHRLVVCGYVAWDVSSHHVVKKFEKIVDLLEVLLDCRDDNQDLPLHVATKVLVEQVLDAAFSEIYPRIVMVLLKKTHEMNPDLLNYRNVDGNTPLHILAASNKGLQVAEMMVDCGADCSLRNFDKQTPLDIAKSHGADCIVNLLSDVGKHKDSCKENGLDRNKLNGVKPAVIWVDDDDDEDGHDIFNGRGGDGDCDSRDYNHQEFKNDHYNDNSSGDSDDKNDTNNGDNNTNHRRGLSQAIKKEPDDYELPVNNLCDNTLATVRQPSANSSNVRVSGSLSHPIKTEHHMNGKAPTVHENHHDENVAMTIKKPPCSKQSDQLSNESGEILKRKFGSCEELGPVVKRPKVTARHTGISTLHPSICISQIQTTEKVLQRQISELQETHRDQNNGHKNSDDEDSLSLDLLDIFNTSEEPSWEKQKKKSWRKDDKLKQTGKEPLCATASMKVSNMLKSDALQLKGKNTSKQSELLSPTCEEDSLLRNRRSIEDIVNSIKQQHKTPVQKENNPAGGNQTIERTNELHGIERIKISHVNGISEPAMGNEQPKLMQSNSTKNKREGSSLINHQHNGFSQHKDEENMPNGGSLGTQDVLETLHKVVPTDDFLQLLRKSKHITSEQIKRLKNEHEDAVRSEKVQDLEYKELQQKIKEKEDFIKQATERIAEYKKRAEVCRKGRELATKKKISCEQQILEQNEKLPEIEKFLNMFEEKADS